MNRRKKGMITDINALVRRPKVTTLYGIKVPAGAPQVLRYDDGTGEELSVPLGTTACASNILPSPAPRYINCKSYSCFQSHLDAYDIQYAASEPEVARCAYQGPLCTSPIRLDGSSA